MNNHQNRAGQSTREMATKRHNKRMWYLALTLVIVFLIVLVAWNPEFVKVGGIGSIGLLIAARLIMNYSDGKEKQLRKEEKRAIRGAKGEEKVGSILETLGEDYLTIHDVLSPYGNIDHIVISKQSGIFLLETKAHGGRVSITNGRLLVNGHDPEKDFIAQTLKNTYWLREKIHHLLGVEIWISPVIVFTNAFVEGTAPIKGIRVTNKKFLLKTLQRSSTRTQNSAVWENREKILKALCA